MWSKYIRVWFGLLLVAGLHYGSAAQAKTGTSSTSRYGDSPAWSDTLKNPLRTVPNSATSGKVTYMRMCTVCHGNGGKGDGIAAASLNPKPADHTSDRVQKQTDGSLFWEVTNGHAPMPAFKTELTEKERWQLICYIRTLKAVPKKP